jgi:hypothetical protein
MNAAIHKSTYGNPWDAPCPQVEFVRVGDVINDARLPLTGTFDDLEVALKKIAPSANVLVVTDIDCAGVPAAGCGRLAAEPLIVGIYPEYDDQLWLHERGHNMGLPHAADFPTMDNSAPPQIGMRFMFWMLGVGHLGKVGSDCAAFMTPKFGSVAQIDGPSAPAQGLLSATAVLMPVATAPEAAASAAFDPEAVLAARAKATGLTINAYRVIGPPWVHGMPVAAVQQLDASDVNSIRRMLDGPVNGYTPQALHALATVGTQADVARLSKPLALPLTAVAPNAGNKDALRNVLRAKLAAPVALGILAARTGSIGAVDTLKRVAGLSAAETNVGAPNAATLSRQALHGLSLANTPESVPFVYAVIAKPEGVAGVKTAPLSASDAARLMKNSSEVRIKGIEGFLKQGNGF